jgi:hypothetical protein
MVDVALLFQPRALATRPARARGVEPGEYVLVHRAPRGQRRRPRAAAALVDLLLALP